MAYKLKEKNRPTCGSLIKEDFLWVLDDFLSEYGVKKLYFSAVCSFLFQDSLCSCVFLHLGTGDWILILIFKRHLKQSALSLKIQFTWALYTWLVTICWWVHSLLLPLKSNSPLSHIKESNVWMMVCINYELLRYKYNYINNFCIANYPAWRNKVKAGKENAWLMVLE